MAVGVNKRPLTPDERAHLQAMIGDHQAESKAHAERKRRTAIALAIAAWTLGGILTLAAWSQASDLEGKLIAVGIGCVGAGMIATLAQAVLQVRRTASPHLDLRADEVFVRRLNVKSARKLQMTDAMAWGVEVGKGGWLLPKTQLSDTILEQIEIVYAPHCGQLWWVATGGGNVDEHEALHMDGNLPFVPSRTSTLPENWPLGLQGASCPPWH